MDRLRLRFRQGRVLFDHRDGRVTDITDLFDEIQQDLDRSLRGRDGFAPDRYADLLEDLDPEDVEALMLDLYGLLTDAAEALVEGMDEAVQDPEPGPDPGADPVLDPEVAPHLPEGYWERREDFRQKRGFKEAASDFHFHQEAALEGDIEDLERDWYRYQVEVLTEAYRSCPQPWVRDKIVEHLRQAEDMLDLL